eukprot:TRINITY_DN4230_c0_g1_i1.p3 TRINITY_DN4230_c0_g1~~TRINITY_DN4230_c0_g1_i1.p3  ORF type:complete len:116 (-),score=11.24 TRINITY_DN4230_c0_g1_i1:178-525(-)
MSHGLFLTIISYSVVTRYLYFFFFLMIRRPPRSTHCISSAASDVYKRQEQCGICNNVWMQIYASTTQFQRKFACYFTAVTIPKQQTVYPEYPERQCQRHQITRLHQQYTNRVQNT